MYKLKSKIYELSYKGDLNSAEAKLSNFIDYLKEIDANEKVLDDYIEAFNLISDLYIFLGKFEELYSYFYKIIYNNPDIHDAIKVNFFIKIGILLFTQRKYSDAQTIFFRTLEIMEELEEGFVSDEQKLIIYNFIAEIYKKISKFEDSELFYKKADPKNFKIGSYNKYFFKNYECGLSDLYILQNKLSEAESILSNSKSINNDERITFSLSYLYLKQDRIDESKQLLKHIINNSPTLALQLIVAADLLIIRGLYEEAECFFKKALEIFPKIHKQFFFLKRHISLYRQQKNLSLLNKYQKLALKSAPKKYDSESLDHIGVAEIWDFIISRYESIYLFNGFCTYDSFYLGLNRCAELILSGECKTKDFYYTPEYYMCIPPMDMAIINFFQYDSYFSPESMLMFSKNSHS